MEEEDEDDCYWAVGGGGDAVDDAGDGHGAFKVNEGGQDGGFAEVEACGGELGEDEEEDVSGNRDVTVAYYEKKKRDWGSE